MHAKSKTVLTSRKLRFTTKLQLLNDCVFLKTILRGRDLYDEEREYKEVTGV